MWTTNITSCWKECEGLQCNEFLIRAQICKNTGRVQAHFLQKFERYTGKNRSTDSQIFKFSKMARIAFSTIPKRFRTPFLTLSNHIENYSAVESDCHLSLQCCQILDRSFNGLSGLLKLELLSSDSFYCQEGSENFIEARNYEKVRVKNHCWSNYTGKITKIEVSSGRFSQNACVLYGRVRGTGVGQRQMGTGKYYRE